MGKVRGKLLEIDMPSVEERAWIGAALARPEVHVPLGCREAPTPELLAADLLELHRGDEVRREPVRYHVLRRRDTGRPVGFFLDFGWDHPRDGTREIDLVIPDVRDRGAGTYHDATVIVSQYMFGNAFAKRLRWRVRARRDGDIPSRIERQGARVIQRQQERHPVTGEWMVTYICEFALADLEALSRRAGVDPGRDYADIDVSVWETLRPARGRE